MNTLAWWVLAALAPWAFLLGGLVGRKLAKWDRRRTVMLSEARVKRFLEREAAEKARDRR